MVEWAAAAMVGGLKLAGGAAAGAVGLAGKAGAALLTKEGLTLGGQLAGTGLETLGTYRAGKKEKEYLYEQAAEAERQSRFEQRMGIERQLELEREKRQAVGQAMAQAAKAGVMVGRGSAARRRLAIARKYGREQELIGMQVGERTRMYAEEAKELRKRGKAARRASRWSIFTSLLTGGAQAGMSAYQMGLFKKPPSTTIAPAGTAKYGGYGGGTLSGRPAGYRSQSLLLPSYR